MSSSPLSLATSKLQQCWPHQSHNLSCPRQQNNHVANIWWPDLASMHCNGHRIGQHAHTHNEGWPACIPRPQDWPTCTNTHTHTHNQITKKNKFEGWPTCTAMATGLANMHKHTHRGTHQNTPTWRDLIVVTDRGTDS